MLISGGDGIPPVRALLLSILSPDCWSEKMYASLLILNPRGRTGSASSSLPCLTAQNPRYVSNMGQPSSPLTYGCYSCYVSSSCSLVAFRKIFIGGLSFETTDEALKRYFEQFGAVADAIVMKDAVSRRSRGFGFITYMNSASVDAALSVKQHVVDNRRVEAKRAVPRSEVPSKVCLLFVLRTFEAWCCRQHFVSESANLPSLLRLEVAPYTATWPNQMIVWKMIECKR